MSRHHYRKNKRCITCHKLIVDYATQCKSCAHKKPKAKCIDCGKEMSTNFCLRCHTKTNTNRDYWFAYFTYIMES